ncbi:hypothetical protein H0H93_008226 [Arthromyces matolae]|nr:hypothetical protein H0H93_008226 [Arthromyces matolae]
MGSTLPESAEVKSTIPKAQSSTSVIAESHVFGQLAGFIQGADLLTPSKKLGTVNPEEVFSPDSAVAQSP